MRLNRTQHRKAIEVLARHANVSVAVMRLTARMQGWTLRDMLNMIYEIETALKTLDSQPMAIDLAAPHLDEE